MGKTSKKTCYKCAYRGTIPGDCHSRCHFNWGKSDIPMPQGKSHGIKMGWWIFPLNYDPTWMIDECKAFSETKDPSKFVEKYDPLLELVGFFGGRF